MSTRMPVVFIGHGSPMNAIEDNEYSRAWRQLAKEMPTPRAVLCISAHWLTRGTRVTVQDHPKTIHDFMGFPAELFEVQYPAPGDPQLAESLARAVDGIIDDEWGLDHGSWSVLRKMYPDADVPVLQLSLDARKTTQQHYDLGQKLRPWRDEGVLILGSGNIVHNLYLMGQSPEPFDWAVDFDTTVKEHISNGQHQKIIDYQEFGEMAAQSAPSSEHFLPLLYVLGAIADDDKISFHTEGYPMGSIAMTSVVAG